jgi:hypothetical protein
MTENEGRLHALARRGYEAETGGKEDGPRFIDATVPDPPDGVVALSKHPEPVDPNPRFDVGREPWEQELIEEERDRLHNLPVGTHTEARHAEERIRREETIRARVRRELEGTAQLAGPPPEEMVSLPPDAVPYSTAPGPIRALDPHSGVDPYGIPTKPVEE